MRKKQMLVRLNSTEKVQMEQQASRAGLPLSSWARMRLLSNGHESVSGDLGTYGTRTDLQVLSLFCGPGGLDEGFRQAGFGTSIAIDIDPECINTMRLNHPQAKAVCADTSAVSAKDLDEWLNREFAPVGVIGGPPCQSFSVSNVHQKERDPRHKLPESYARLLKELNVRRPVSFFVFENVPGLLGKKHSERYSLFKKLFRDAGFEIFENVLNAKMYGVPQDRERVFIIGINRKLHPDCTWQPPEPEARTKTVRDAIFGLSEPVFNESGLDPMAFAVHPNHWALVPRSDKFSKGKLKQGEMWGRSFRTLTWDKPSWAVAYGHREVHVHPKGHRRLSIYEAMRLQTFPDCYRLTGNMSAQIRLVSDAVPPRMAWYLGVRIRQVLGL
jgi:DNA (cytosine-5)-methyltransferase 1